MFVYGADPELWARRFDIEPFAAPCYVCGTELKTTLPFASGPLRGLAAPRGACGHDTGPYCVVRADGGWLF
jgi:hypothetical protein